MCKRNDAFYFDQKNDFFGEFFSIVNSTIFLKNCQIFYVEELQNEILKRSSDGHVFFSPIFNYQTNVWFKKGMNVWCR
jgi:hypothetical protein